MHSPEIVRSVARKSLQRARQLIIENIQESDAWAVRALLAIYDRQTADEQSTGSTRYANSVGFSGCDAEILTSFAEQVIKHRKGEHKYLTPLSATQMALLRRRIVRYAGQLARVVREREMAAA